MVRSADKGTFPLFLEVIKIHPRTRDLILFRKMVSPREQTLFIPFHCLALYLINPRPGVLRIPYLHCFSLKLPYRIMLSNNLFLRVIMSRPRPGHFPISKRSRRSFEPTHKKITLVKCLFWAFLDRTSQDLGRNVSLLSLVLHDLFRNNKYFFLPSFIRIHGPIQLFLYCKTQGLGVGSCILTLC
jgi:hypothetical protein